MLDLVVSASLAVHLLGAGAVQTARDDRLFSAEAIRGHVEFLADDRLEGRGSGSRGFDLAAHYVATQFRAVGLEPAADGGWFQPTPMVERTPNSTAGTLTVGETAFPLAEHALGTISGEGAQRWSGEAVFVGYGLVGPDAGVDDYQGIDVRGKAVVLHNGRAASLLPEVSESLSRRRAEAAYERGAVGMITLFDGEPTRGTWAEWRADFEAPFFNWLREDGEPYRLVPMRFSAVLDPEAAARLFDGAPVDAAGIAARAARGEPLPAFVLTQRLTLSSENRWRRFTSPNVIGMVRGTDPAVAGECVLATSHLDHLGVDPSAPAEDKIFNGALDNASRVAALLEMARGVAAAPARRPVVFAATTGEELGLLGSDYLAAHGVPGCERIVAVVNIDGGVPLHDLPEATALGGWHSTIGRAFETIAAANGVRAGADDTPPTDFFERTDHFSFVRRGVPGIYLVMSSGEDEADAPWRARVHTPGDDLTQRFNWEAGARFARLAHDLVRALADGPATPRWYADSPIGRRYAPDEPKAARP